MRSVTLIILLATVSVTLTIANNENPNPVKLDKNLRRALLKALTDLEAESAEQHRREDQEGTPDDEETIFVRQKESLRFDGFPGDDEEIPSEDKLQNSTYSTMSIEKATIDDTRSFHVHKIITPDKPKIESSTNLNKIEPITYRPTTTQTGQEILKSSASTGLAIANALIPPKPTASSPTASPESSASIEITTPTPFSTTKDKTEEVKIFQAPLVAAFTVQQDERGIPKSVVPIFRTTGEGSQALTLQEQLEFKQKLLEKQLAELQHQQIQQTQLLLYEQQRLRQKQQHDIYVQEQARLKQFNEQQRIYQFQQHQQQIALQQQQLPFLDQNNNLLSLQPPLETSNVHFQPSIGLEVPNVAAPQPFQSHFQEQLRNQQIRQQQRFQQQSFPPGPFPTEFQPPIQLASSNRFNRQEAFNAVGNFGLNFDNKSQATKNTFGFTLPPRNNVLTSQQQNFIYNPYSQFRGSQLQGKPPTPAKQIQHLLYQSGIAGDIGNGQGSSGSEDLNIVSKVLALNVGALPINNLQYTSNRGNLFAKSIA